MVSVDQVMEREFYEMFYQRVHNIAFFTTMDREYAQDIVQETFLKAFRQVHTLKDQTKLEAWVSSIATRTALDYLRKIKRYREIAMEHAELQDIVTSTNGLEPSVEQLVEGNAVKDLLAHEISNLILPHQEVVVLKHGQELKDEEIARMLDIKVGTVKSRINRAKSSLKKSLEGKMSFTI